MYRVQRSKKHFVGREMLAEKWKREGDIADAHCVYNTQQIPAKEELPPEQQVYQVKVLTSFFNTGVPISKIDYFRELCEENALRLARRLTTSDSIPFVQQEEQEKSRRRSREWTLSLV